MALCYRINLIREEVARRQSQQAMLQLVTISLLIFALMSAVTLAVYFVREYQITVAHRRMRFLVQKVEGEGVEFGKVEGLRKESRRLDAELGFVTEVVRNSASWAEMLAWLGECVGSSAIRVGKIRSEALGSDVSVHIEGVCVSDRPMKSMHAFMEAVAKHEGFGAGRIGNLSEVSENALNFRVTIPLRAVIPETQVERQNDE